MEEGDKGAHANFMVVGDSCYLDCGDALPDTNRCQSFSNIVPFLSSQSQLRKAGFYKW